MNEPELKPLTVSQYVALMIYLIISMAIWIPIGYLAASVNLNVTILIGIMLFIISVCKMYLGVK